MVLNTRTTICFSMPRNYKNIQNKTYKKYDENNITTALREYESTKMSFVSIAKQCNILKSVL